MWFTNIITDHVLWVIITWNLTLISVGDVLFQTPLRGATWFPARHPLQRPILKIVQICSCNHTLTAIKCHGISQTTFIRHYVVKYCFSKSQILTRTWPWKSPKKKLLRGANHRQHLKSCGNWFLTRKLVTRCQHPTLHSVDLYKIPSLGTLNSQLMIHGENIGYGYGNRITYKHRSWIWIDQELLTKNGNSQTSTTSKTMCGCSQSKTRGSSKSEFI